MTLRVVSYGGGVQSTALLVLAAQGKIDFKTFLFCNVGDDSEHPATLAYVHDVAMPYAQEHGLEIHELQRRKRDGTPETIYGRIMAPGKASMVIPVRLSSGAPNGRACTGDFKIKVIQKWLKQHGATVDDPAVSAIGISLDEFQRMRTDSGANFQRLVYPLVEMRKTRQDCNNIISGVGLMLPPKSSCYFCPWHTVKAWQKQARDEPELFAKSVALEAYISERSQQRGHGPVWMTDKMVPLEQVIGTHDQEEFDFEDTCESGYCMT